MQSCLSDDDIRAMKSDLDALEARSPLPAVEHARCLVEKAEEILRKAAEAHAEAGQPLDEPHLSSSCAGMAELLDRPRDPSPADASSLVWMTGPCNAVVRNAFTDGPEPEPDLLVLRMTDGDILVGKDRQGTIRVLRQMTPAGLVDLSDPRG